MLLVVFDAVATYAPLLFGEFIYKGLLFFFLFTLAVAAPEELMLAFGGGALAFVDADPAPVADV
jgi:hypothetical protein